MLLLRFPAILPRLAPRTRCQRAVSAGTDLFLTFGKEKVDVSAQFIMNALLILSMTFQSSLLFSLIHFTMVVLCGPGKYDKSCAYS